MINKVNPDPNSNNKPSPIENNYKKISSQITNELNSLRLSFVKEDNPIEQKTVLENLITQESTYTSVQLDQLTTNIQHINSINFNMLDNSVKRIWDGINNFSLQDAQFYYKSPVHYDNVELDISYAYILKIYNLLFFDLNVTISNIASKYSIHITKNYFITVINNNQVYLFDNNYYQLKKLVIYLYDIIKFGRSNPDLFYMIKHIYNDCPIKYIYNDCLINNLIKYNDPNIAFLLLMSLLNNLFNNNSSIHD